MSYEVVPSPSYPTPNWSQFGDTIGNLANTYRSGQQQNQQRDISTAFQNGIPTDANGNPDYNKIMQILAQKGDINAILSLSGPALDQNQLKQAQIISPLLLGGAPVAGAPTGGPTAPTGAAVPPAMPAPAVSNVPAPGGAQLGDLSGAAAAFPSVNSMVFSSLPDDWTGGAGKMQTIASNIAKAVKVDPTAPMTQDQAAKAQSILSAYMQRNNVAPKTADNGGGLPAAILGQESGNRDDVSNSVDGAVGPGQVMPKTFAAYAQPGEDINNPADNRRVSGRILEDYNQRYGGDVARAAVAYFSGPNNVAPPGSPTPYKRDLKDGNGKSTSAYVNDIIGRLGGGNGQPAASAPGGGDLPPASAAAGIPTRRPPSNQVADNSAQPLVPQYPLPVDPRTGQRYTDPQTAIAGIDDQIMRLTGNRFAGERIKVLQNEQDRIVSSITPMKVAPSDTYVDPRTGKTVYQGPWATGSGMNPQAVEGAAERYLATGELPKGMGRGMQGSAQMSAIINRAYELADERGIDTDTLQDKWAMKGKDSQIKAIADGIETGKQPPVLTGLYGMSGPVREELQKRGVNLANDQLKWQRAQKQIASLNGPQQVRFVGLAKSVVNTIDEVKNLSEQMQLSGVPALNKAELTAYIQTQGNTPNGQLATRYVTAVGTLKEEFANLANGGYAPNEAAWELANKQINENYGVKQLGASLPEIQKLINYRVNAIPGMGDYGPGAPNEYLPQQGGANPGAAPPQPGAPSSAAPQPDKDGWVTLPGGIRIREAQ